MINRLKTVLVMCLAAALMAVSCEEPKVYVTGIQIIPAEKTLNVDESFDVMVMITPENATNAKYQLSVEDPTILSLEANKVTALAAGETNVIATSEDGGKTATCKVIVKGGEDNPDNPENPDNPTNPDSVAVTGVEMLPESKTLIIGETLELTVTVLPENATNTKYTLASDSDAVTLEGNKVTAVKEGTATITVTTEDGGKTATSMIFVEKDEEPVNGGNGKADGFVMTILDLMHNDILVAVDAPKDDSSYFIWAEEADKVGSWSDQELIDYTINTVYGELKTAMGYTKIDSVLGEQGYRGDRAKISVSNACTAYKMGGEKIVLREIKPETRYVIYGYGINSETGEATTGVFKLTSATTAAPAGNGVTIKDVTPNNIIADITVEDEEMPYMLFLRKAEEVEGLDDDALFKMDMDELQTMLDKEYYGAVSLDEYLSKNAQYGSLRNYNFLGNAYLDAETEYTVYFYGLDGNNKRSTEIYRADATTESVTMSGVTFEVSSEKDEDSGEITKLKVVPSDQNVWYVKSVLLEDPYGLGGGLKAGEDPIENAVAAYKEGVVGAQSLADGYSMSVEIYLTGDGVQAGICNKGTYEDVVDNLLYSAGVEIFVVTFTVDEKTGVITSEPVVNSFK